MFHERETAAPVFLELPYPFPTSSPLAQVARPLAQESQNRPPDLALARIVLVWPKLPEAIRKAMLALAESGQ